MAARSTPWKRLRSRISISSSSGMPANSQKLPTPALNSFSSKTVPDPVYHRQILRAGDLKDLDTLSGAGQCAGAAHACPWPAGVLRRSRLRRCRCARRRLVRMALTCSGVAAARAAKPSIPPARKAAAAVSPMPWINTRSPSWRWLSCACRASNAVPIAGSSKGSLLFPLGVVYLLPRLGLDNVRQDRLVGRRKLGEGRDA